MFNLSINKKNPDNANKCHPLVNFHRTHASQKSYEQLTSRVFQYFDFKGDTNN